MMRFALAAMLLPATFGMAVNGVPARAEVIDRTFALTASDFVGEPNRPPAPFAVVTGTFRVSFDNAVATTDRTAGIDLVALGIPLGFPIGYSYDVNSDSLFIGGVDRLGGGGAFGDVGSIFSGTDDFYAIINAASFAPVLASLNYTSASAPANAFGARSRAISFTDGVPVPEPASLVLLGSGLLGLVAKAATGLAGFPARFAPPSTPLLASGARGRRAGGRPARRPALSPP